MARFWRPAIRTATSSSGIGADSVRQRTYSRCPDESPAAAITGGLGPARFAAEARWPPSVPDAATTCLLSLAARHLNDLGPRQAASREAYRAPANGGARRRVCDLPKFRYDRFWILYTVRSGPIGLLLPKPTSTVSTASHSLPGGLVPARSGTTRLVT